MAAGDKSASWQLPCLPPHKPEAAPIKKVKVEVKVNESSTQATGSSPKKVKVNLSTTQNERKVKVDVSSTHEPVAAPLKKVKLKLNESSTKDTGSSSPKSESESKSETE